MLISTQKSHPVAPDYELLQRIGRGAYGEVGLARSTAAGVLRAAKIVWRDTFEDDRPFQREFEGIQRFERFSHEHPSQIALFHIGTSWPNTWPEDGEVAAPLLELAKAAQKPSYQVLAIRGYLQYVQGDKSSRMRTN